MDGNGPHPYINSSLRILLAGASAVAFAGVVACIGPAGFAQGNVTMIATERMPIGEPPADFDVARTGQGEPARWQVIEDKSATGGHAIEQVSTDRTDYRFPLAIYKPLSARDVEVSLRFKPVGGEVDQAGGIALRLIDPDNYYVARANALEDNVRFYRMVRGRREQLGGVNTKVAPNQWHQLALRAEGNRFTVTFNGKVLFTSSDPTFAGVGRIALWTKADSVTRFDSITITPLP